MENVDDSVHDQSLSSKLSTLVRIIDNLRDVDLNSYIDLPRICVIGTQSSGKSSVLEMIMGLDCLPRGEGVVTRRPLELRLVHLSGRNCDPYAVFDIEPEKHYSNFEVVRSRIVEITDRDAGQNKRIISSPIVLSVFGSMCPDLTLIDLPGVTRVPLKNSDQGEDIEAITRQMAYEYAKDPRTIVLAVIAGNTDTSTSDALQIARRVDPRGIRTLGVITKLDLMDSGVTGVGTLNNEEVPLRLGYVAVKCRSSQDCREGLSISSALEKERNFFSSHPAYKSLDSNLTGIPSLTRRLSDLLMAHIRHCLPEIRRDVQQRLSAVSLEVKSLGEPLPQDAEEMRRLLWCQLTSFTASLRDIIRGSGPLCVSNASNGAKIRQIYNDFLKEYAEHDMVNDISDYELDDAIIMHEGDNLPGFPSPELFSSLIQPHISKLTDPVYDTLELVCDCLISIFNKLSHDQFKNFSKLDNAVLEICSDVLSRSKETTRDLLEKIIQAENKYLFTNDAVYLQSHGVMVKPYGEPTKSELREGESGSFTTNAMRQLIPDVNMFKGKLKCSVHFIREMKLRMSSYFNVVLRNLRDIIPKIIGVFLVRNVQESLHFELHNNLSKMPTSELFYESEEIAQERCRKSKELQTLRDAFDILNKDLSKLFSNNTTADTNFEKELRESRQDTPLVSSTSLKTAQTDSQVQESAHKEKSPLNVTMNTIFSKSYQSSVEKKKFAEKSTTVFDPLFASY